MAKKVLVIGDTIIDETINTKSIGVSLESPTMKTEYVSSNISYGGAANIVKNISHLGSDTQFITIGSDLDISGVDVISMDGIPHKKTRIWCSHGDSDYKLLQVNHNGTSPLSSHDFILNVIDDQDVVVISDYKKGLFHGGLISEIIQKCSDLGIECICSSQISDSHYDYGVFSKSDFTIMNANEYDTFKNRVMYLLYNCSCVVTMGKKGSCCYSSDGKTKIYSGGYPVTSIDTTGAGDCFVAAFVHSDETTVGGRMDFANKYAALSTTVKGTDIYEPDK